MVCEEKNGYRQYLVFIFISKHSLNFCFHNSPQGSRPQTPKSDTEVERQKSLEQQDCLIPVNDDNETVTWEWGNLPQTAPKDNTGATSAKHGML